RITDEHGIGWDVPGLTSEVATILSVPPSLSAEALSGMKPRQIEEALVKQAEALYEEKEKELGAANMRVLERLVMLRIIDTLWVEQLTMMEHMRQGIGLRAMAQQDPLVAYKREGHRLFQDLMAGIQHDVVHAIYHVKIEKRPATEPAPSPMAQAAGRGDSRQRQKAAVGRKVGRNDPCPCGSGKKYKHCCGK
ncbi:MAG: SEC-C metal-binding domain-containing protein, partial [Chloroflexota bacterium]